MVCTTHLHIWMVLVGSVYHCAYRNIIYWSCLGNSCVSWTSEIKRSNDSNQSLHVYGDFLKWGYPQIIHV